MNLKRILVANLVISSLALTTGGVAIALTTLDNKKVEPVIYECVCPVEEVENEEPVVEEEVVEETKPVEQIEQVEPSNLGRFMLTAYCACSQCCGKSDGITATGTIATQGRTIAVDPRVIPYGTEVIINGNTYVAEDCGGSINGNRIDVFFNSHSEALQFGVQYADVYIVRS